MSISEHDHEELHEAYGTFHDDGTILPMKSAMNKHSHMEFGEQSPKTNPPATGFGVGATYSLDLTPHLDLLHDLELVYRIRNSSTVAKVSEVHRLASYDATGAAATTGGGDFYIVFNGQATSQLAHSATAVQIKAALEALPWMVAIGGTVTVVGTFDTTGTVDITYDGPLTGVLISQVYGIPVATGVGLNDGAASLVVIGTDVTTAGSNNGRMSLCDVFSYITQIDVKISAKTIQNLHSESLRVKFLSSSTIEQYKTASYAIGMDPDTYGKPYNYLDPGEEREYYLPFQCFITDHDMFPLRYVLKSIGNVTFDIKLRQGAGLFNTDNGSGVVVGDLSLVRTAIRFRGEKLAPSVYNAKVSMLRKYKTTFRFLDMEVQDRSLASFNLGASNTEKINVMNNVGAYLFYVVKSTPADASDLFYNAAKLNDIDVQNSGGNSIIGDIDDEDEFNRFVRSRMDFPSTALFKDCNIYCASFDSDLISSVKSGSKGGSLQMDTQEQIKFKPKTLITGATGYRLIIVAFKYKTFTIAPNGTIYVEEPKGLIDAK